LANPRVDTLTLARRLVRDEVPDCRLATLAARFRTATAPTHRALDDVLATAGVLHGLFERAAGFGVLALDDLLSLPSSPLALRKLPLLAGLPRAPGVYVFRAADGRAVHVGRAADVRGRVRSLFRTGGRRRVARLLRETVAIEYLPAVHPLEAAVTQPRLHHAHRPWFDSRPRRWKGCAYLKLTAGRWPRLAVVHSRRADGALYLGPFPGAAPARFVRSAIEAALPLRRGGAGVVETARRGLSGEGDLLVAPLAAVLDGLRAAGRLVLEVGGHVVELDGGRLVSVDRGSAPGAPPPAIAGRAEADEVLAVGRWLRREARAGTVRLVGAADPGRAAALACVLDGVEYAGERMPG